MPENVIVTICYQNMEADFELPSKVPYRAMEESLKEAVCLQFQGIKLSEKKIVLRCTGDYYIQPNCTLEEYSIFDGEVLELEIV